VETEMKSYTVISTLSAAAVLGLTSFAQAACEPDQVATKYPDLAGRVITIGADPQTPPYVMRNPDNFDEVIGIDVELAIGAMECAGLEYKFVLGAWSGLLPAVQSGQIDIMWDNLYYKPSRAEVVDFVTYMQAATATMVAKGNAAGIHEVDDLCGTVTTFGLGSSSEIIVKEQSEACIAEGKDEIIMMTFQDLAAGLRLLDSGRADALFWDLGFIDNLAANNPDKYERAYSTMDGFEIGAAVANGEDQLLGAIHEGLTALQADGRSAEIFEKYGVDPGLEIPSVIKTE
jgi:polar amino acid transport system substrate-binding protein